MPYLKYSFGVLLIITLGIFLRFFLLADKSLWFDEGFSLYYSQGSDLQDIITRILGTDTGDRFQPLYYLVLYYWRLLFGSSEFAVRSLSALLGAGAVVILFLTASRLYGKSHAIWLGLFLAVSSYGIYYSQQTRAYALLLFLASLQIYFFSRALNAQPTRGEIFYRLMFWIVTAIGLFASIFIGMFALALCISHLIVERNYQRWLKWWLPTALFCLPAVAFYLASPVATEPTKVNVTLSRQSVIQNLVFVLYGLLVGETYGPPIEQLRSGNKTQILFNYLPHLVILLLVICIIVFSLIKAQISKNQNSSQQKLDKFFVSVLATTLVLAIIFSTVTKFNWLPRHSFYIFIPLALILPIAARNKPSTSSQKSRLLTNAQIAIITLAIINIYSVSNYYFNKDYLREDYRVIAQYLIAQSSSAKSVLLYGAPNLLPYYGDSLTLDGSDLDTNNLANEVRTLTNDANKVLIAISYQSFWEWKKKFSVEKSMADLYNLQSKVSFTNFNIYHFIKKS